MSRYETKTVEGRTLQNIKVAKTLSLNDEKLLLLEKRVKLVIEAGSTLCATFPQITESNFNTFQPWLKDYFQLEVFHKSRVDAINAVLVLTKNGLTAQKATMVIKVAGNLDGAEGEVRF